MGTTTVVKMGSKQRTLRAYLRHCQLLFITQLQKTLVTTVQLRRHQVRRVSQRFSGKLQKRRTKVLLNYLLNSKSWIWSIFLISVQLWITDQKPFFQTSKQSSYLLPQKYSRYLMKMRIWKVIHKILLSLFSVCFGILFLRAKIAVSLNKRDHLVL